MEYIYPAVFHANEDGSYTVTFPDLPGCVSEGKSLGDALYMAEDALRQWAEYLLERQPLPAASAIDTIDVGDTGFVNLVRVDVRDRRAAGAG